VRSAGLTGAVAIRHSPFARFKSQLQKLACLEVESGITNPFR